MNSSTDINLFIDENKGGIETSIFKPTKFSVFKKENIKSSAYSPELSPST